METTLLVLAAGMGSRYGGLKQLDSIGPSGEAIIDYSIYDAIKAGFDKVVFVIRRDFSDAFKEKFHKKISKHIKIEYVYQEVENLPKGYDYQDNREKPRGTGHAVWVAKHAINGPFAMINADDFYGRDAYKVMVEFLKNKVTENLYSIVGYKLGNTMSDFGGVNRGVCYTDENGHLKEIVETLGIEKKDGKNIYVDGIEKELDNDTIVSMNFFGFHVNKFDHLEEHFKEFLEEFISHHKEEFYVPKVIDSLNKKGLIDIEILKSDDKWFGVSYQEDKPFVIDSINKLINKGLYPENLWG